MVSSRISLTAMLAMGLCLSQGTGVVEAGGGSNLIRDLGSDAALALGHKDLSDQITGSFQDAGRKLQSEGGISGLFEHAVRRFGEKAVQNGVPAAVRVAANEAGVPTTPAGNRKLQGGVEPLHLPFHLPTDPLGELKMVTTEVLPHEETNAPVQTRKLQSEGGISGLFEHAVRRFGEKAVQNGVPAAVRVAANEAGVPTTPEGTRKLQGGVEPLHLPFHLPTDPLGEVKMVATEVLPHEETNAPVLTRKLQGGGSNFIRDLGADAALALRHKDLSDQIMGSFQN